MPDIFREISRCEELSGKPPKQIKVTVVAIPGSILDAPMLDKLGRRRPERQILVHPDDWAQLGFHNVVPSLVTKVHGIPVVHEL